MFNDFIESIRETADSLGLPLLPEDEYAIARLEYLDKVIHRVREMALTPICEGYTPIKDVLIRSTREMDYRQRQILDVIDQLDNALPGTQLHVCIYDDRIVSSRAAYGGKLLVCYRIFIDEVASEILPSLYEETEVLL